MGDTPIYWHVQCLVHGIDYWWTHDEMLQADSDVARAIVDRFAERGWDMLTRYESHIGVPSTFERLRAEHGPCTCVTQAYTLMEKTNDNAVNN